MKNNLFAHTAMSKDLFVLLFISSMVCACESSQNTPILNLNIEFDGGKKDYYEKYNLWTEISDSQLISQIIIAIDTSKALLVCPSIRPVMWEIDVFAKYENKKEEHLFKIASNTSGILSLQKGGRCYDNPSLVEMLMNIVKVEDIRSFQGPMNQDDYDHIKIQK